MSKNAHVGDILLLSDTNTNPPSMLQSTQTYKRVVGLNGQTLALESVPGFQVGREEHVFRIPADTNGNPIVSAPPSSSDVEYLRFVPQDWASGSVNDIAHLSATTPSDASTVLEDGSTSLVVHQGQLVSTGLEGFPNGIQVSSTGYMTCQAWGTRMDFVFTGTQGSTLINILVDGVYSYQVTLAGTGYERHTAFLEGIEQTHTVQITSASALPFTVSEWIFHSTSAGVLNGTPLSCYTVLKNYILPGPIVNEKLTYDHSYDFAPVSFANPLTNSPAGIRVVDPSKAGARLFSGGRGTSWAVVSDFVDSPRFGHYLQTSQQYAAVEINFVGTSIELYVETGPNYGTAQAYVGSTLVLGPSIVQGAPVQIIDGTSVTLGTQGIDPTGNISYQSATTQKSRILISNLPQGRHVLVLQNTSSQSINLHAYAECPGIGIQVGHHFQSFQDLRNFASLTALQGGAGLTSLLGDVITKGSAGTTQIQKIQGTPVSGTTGTNQVVFSNAPTINQPVVTGIQQFLGANGYNWGIANQLNTQGLEITPSTVPNGSTYSAPAITFLASASGVSIGINNPTPNAAAALDIASTTQGVALPRMTAQQMVAIASPPVGLLVYNTSANCLYAYGPSGWEASGGGGSGGASLSPADGYQWLVSESSFQAAPGGAGTNILATSTGTYNQVSDSYQMACDKTLTVTVTGTGYTLSKAPSFTVTPGCILWVGSLSAWAVIKTVTSQTLGVLDAAFSSNVTAAACMVSQAVYTTDLTAVGDATHHGRGIDVFPSTSIPTAHIEYADSLDTEYDPVVNALVVVSASNAGAQAAAGFPLSSTFSPIFTRPNAPAAWNNYSLSANTPSQRLFLTFFPNPNNASVVGTANVLQYNASLYAQASVQNGGVLNSAFCTTDGAVKLNATPAVVNSLTQITLSWPYTPNLNVGLPDGDLEVIVEGVPIPRYFSGVVGQYYTEISPFVFGLSANYSGLQYSVHVRRRQGSVDTSSQNALILSGMFNAIVGSTSQVGTGQAGYSSLQAAVTALASVTNARILILPGVTLTENVVVSAPVYLQGSGLSSVVSGTFTLAAGSSGSIVKGFKVTGAISIVSNNSFYQESWQSLGQTYSNTGTGNVVQIQTL